MTWSACTTMAGCLATAKSGAVGRAARHNMRNVVTRDLILGLHQLGFEGWVPSGGQGPPFAVLRIFENLALEISDNHAVGIAAEDIIRVDGDLSAAAGSVD